MKVVNLEQVKAIIRNVPVKTFIHLIYTNLKQCKLKVFYAHFFSAEMWRRLTCCEADPLIAARFLQYSKYQYQNNVLSIFYRNSTTKMLYAEFSWTGKATLLQSSVLDGMDVYIRKAPIN